LDWTLHSSNDDSSDSCEAGDSSGSMSEEERLSLKNERERKMRRSRDRRSERAEKRKQEEQERMAEEIEGNEGVVSAVNTGTESQSLPAASASVPTVSQSPETPVPAPAATLPTAAPGVVTTAASPPPAAAAPAAVTPPSAPPAPPAARAIPVMSDEEKEKIQIALEELKNVIRDVPVLDFLKARLGNAMERGLDAQTLLGFFRISGRMLKEEYEKKKEHIKKLEGDNEELKKRGDPGKQLFRSPYAWPPQSPPPAEKPAEKTREEPSGEDLFVMKESLKQKEQKINELVDMCDRYKTDFNNLRNRLQTDITLQVSKASEEMICSILPVVDNFERALKASQTSSDIKSVVQGIEMIRYQMDEILKKMGVMSIKAEGQPFDPRIHEAIAIIETDEHAEDTVIEELNRGYMINNKVLRPSMVRVAKKVSSPASTE